MFKRRLAVFVGLFLCAVAVLAARLSYLQIHQGDYYSKLVKERLRERPRWLETVRGRIYDCKGRVLADDRPRFDVCMQYDLVRLYDERYWRYRQAKLFKQTYGDDPAGSAEEFVAAQVTRHARQMEVLLAELKELPEGGVQVDASQNISKAGRVAGIVVELSELCGAPVSDLTSAAVEGGLRAIARLCRVSVGAIDDAAERMKTQVLLEHVRRICDVSQGDMRRAMKRVNGEYYDKQLARARRKWYDQQDKVFEPAANAGARASDFAEKIPSEIERICAVYDMEPIAEMVGGQVIVPDISEDIALIVGERIVGAFPGGPREDRPVFIRASKQRYYPYGDAACHLIGQMGPLREQDELLSGEASAPPPTEVLAGYRRGDRRGDWGLEYMFERRLRGRRGWVYKDGAEPGGVSREIEPTGGDDVVMTIDIELQRTIEALFERRGRRGGAVVIDVPTGEIRAAASVPTFDLNTFYEADNYEEIVHDRPSVYWINRALAKGYQPGSTIKPTILLGAMENGVVDAETEYHCHRDNVDWQFGPKHIYNHGAVRGERAIRQSCNFYFARVAEAMGNEMLLQWLRDAGFGHRVLAWPAGEYEQRVGRAFAETPGAIHHEDRPQPWPGELRFLGVGLAPFEAAVVQMANAVATIARDGLFRGPTLVRLPAPTPVARRLTEFATGVSHVKQAMSQVIYEPSGTGYEAFHPLGWDRGQVELMGKTGTTDNSVFVCGARTDDGRCLAVAVVVEVEASGGADGARMARGILEACGQSEYEYLPSPEVYVRK